MPDPAGAPQPAAGYAAKTPTILVTTGQDVVNAGDGLTSLREAVALANQMGGKQTIAFAPEVGDPVVTLGKLTITDDLAIQGGGRTLDANYWGQILVIEGSAAKRVAVELDELSLKDGVGGDAGAGAIDLVFADLALKNATIANNQGINGAIHVDADSSLVATGVTFVGNEAQNGGALVVDGEAVIARSLFLAASSSRTPRSRAMPRPSAVPSSPAQAP
jgi:hypothetical protein